MLLGTDQTDITPLHPVELAGFDHRKDKTEEMFNRIYVKSFMLKHKDSSFLLIVADLIWWDSTFISELKKEINEKCHIPMSQICFHATHNHSGPQTTFRFSQEIGSPSIVYLTFLKRQVLLSVRKSLLNLSRVDAHVHKGRSAIGVNRRKKINENIEMEPNFAGSVDDDLTVISFKENNNKMKAIWIHYTCHPTSTDANVISSEYTGICCQKIEEEFPNSHVAFLQGFCSDIRPALIKDDEFFRGEINDMCQVGEVFSNDVSYLLQM